MPKYNMYQSLHTTVIGRGKPVELQIRTQQMHRAAEFGVAAHWRYKNGSVGDKSRPDDLAWVRQLLEWQREPNPDEFMDSLRFDLNSSEVFVFTPQGDIIALPPAPPRSTSPTRCTPRWATAMSGRGSTVGWCRSSPN